MPSPTRIRPRAFTLEARPDRDGLHLVLPESVARLALHGRTPDTGGTVPVYAVEMNGVIQLSYERLELTIPAINLRPEDFVPAQTTP